MLKQTEISRQQTAMTIMAVFVLFILLTRYYQKGCIDSNPIPTPTVIEVQGCVKHPGVYALSQPDATVGDVLRTCGGPDEASIDVVERQVLDNPVKTGQLIHVAHHGNALQFRFASMAAAARLTLGKKLDLNHVTEDDLLLIPKMRPPFAKAITARGSVKPWTKLDELREIPGIGPKTVEKWSQYLEAGAGEHNP